MADLGDDFTIPNAYGLLPGEFGHDMDAYRAALGFLGDLATGSPEDLALENNGGSQPELVAWQRSDKFRRVLSKCRAAGEAERDALRRAEADAAATEAEGAAQPTGQVFVSLDELPERHSVFSLNAPRDSYGTA